MDERGRSPGADEAVRPAEAVGARVARGEGAAGPGVGPRVARRGRGAVEAAFGLALLGTLASACASAPAKPVDVAAQERLLIVLRGQNALYVRQIEELQNRIFILEDRLDSRRVAAERRAAPELPPATVVTLSNRPRIGAPGGSSAGMATASLRGEDATTNTTKTPVTVDESPRPSSRAERRAAARAARKAAAERRLEERRALLAADQSGSEVAARGGRDPDEMDIPEGPFLSIETPVEYVGDAAIDTETATAGRSRRRDDTVRAKATEPALAARPTVSPSASLGHPAGVAPAAAAPVEPPATAAAPPPPTAVPPSSPPPAATAKPAREEPGPLSKVVPSLRSKPSVLGRPRPLDLYKDALASLQAGDHTNALVGFRRFLALHPRHDYADNAQYWIGECFYDQASYPAAVQEFRRVVERYPRGNKVPDAMLKLGFSLAASGDAQGARRVLSSLVKAYPDNQASRLAFAKLDSTSPLRSSSFPTSPPSPTPPLSPSSPPATVPGALPQLKAEASFGAPVSALLPARENPPR